MNRRAIVMVWVTLVVITTGVPTAGAGEGLDAIRERLRSQAGVARTIDDADLPMVVVTPLPGDTPRVLALELTGSADAESVIRKIAPRLVAGKRIYLPRAILEPRLSDPRLEPLALGGATPTLWRLVRARLRTAPKGTAVTVRNVQRLNAIVDPTKMVKGARVLVPRSLLVGAPAQTVRALRVSKVYRASKFSDLDRTASASDFSRSLRRRLQKEGQWKRQLGRRSVDLVVLHTTEHREAPFDNVARYIQRKRLANYLIGPDGRVYEIVPEIFRAHGAGQSLWEGRYAVDFNAINIEIYARTAPGASGEGIRTVQYDALVRLLADIRSRHPGVHDGRVLTHRMVAVSYKFGTRSRKGDPYVFDWAKTGLPDNSRVIDQDVLLGRARLCTDDRYADRVTEGQTAAARYQGTL